ncbi:MAG: putative F420-dependent oxidoreductase [Acidimicrobiales bacterium]|jgi:probable F420-dependent oxidoreductase
MNYGLAIFPTDKTIGAIELGREAEERGFESLWFPEHSHIPTSRVSPWGGRKGAPPLPEQYWRTHDQFVAFGAVAAVTTKLKLGTGITLVAQRDPLWMAKEVATVDAISDGRFLFGIGYGWNKEELAHHGVNYTDRRAVVRERILAMKEIWTKDEAEYHGEHVDFSSSWSWPKPTQTPHPPVILGGAAGPRTAADIAEFCDGWMPIGGRHGLEAGWGEVVKACEAIGRDPKLIELGVFGAPTDKAGIEELAEAGVTRAVFMLPQGPRDEVMEEIEQLTILIQS